MKNTSTRRRKYKSKKSGGSLKSKSKTIKTPIAFLYTPEEFKDLVSEFEQKRDTRSIWQWLHRAPENTEILVEETKYSPITYVLANIEDLSIDHFEKLTKEIDRRKYTDKSGQTILIASCLGKNIDLVNHILEKYGDYSEFVNQKDDDGNTFLSILLHYLNYEYEIEKHIQTKKFDEYLNLFEKTIVYYNGDLKSVEKEIDKNQLNIIPKISTLLYLEKEWVPLISGDHGQSKLVDLKSIYELRSIILDILEKTTMCEEIQKLFPSFKSTTNTTRYCALLFAIGTISYRIFKDMKIMIKGGKAIQMNLNDYLSDDIDIIVVPQRGKYNTTETLKKTALLVAKLLLFLMNDPDKQPQFSILDNEQSEIIKFSYKTPYSGFNAMSDISYRFSSIDPVLKTIAYKENIVEKKEFTYKGYVCQIRYHTLQNIVNERLFYLYKYSGYLNIPPYPNESLSDKANRRFLDKACHQLKTIYQKDTTHDRDKRKNIERLLTDIIIKIHKQEGMQYIYNNVTLASNHLITYMLLVK